MHEHDTHDIPAKPMRWVAALGLVVCLAGWYTPAFTRVVWVPAFEDVLHDLGENRGAAYAERFERLIGAAEVVRWRDEHRDDLSVRDVERKAGIGKELGGFSYAAGHGVVQLMAQASRESERNAEEAGAVLAGANLAVWILWLAPILVLLGFAITAAAEIPWPGLALALSTGLLVLAGGLVLPLMPYVEPSMGNATQAGAWVLPAGALLVVVGGLGCLRRDQWWKVLLSALAFLLVLPGVCALPFVLYNLGR